MQKSDIDETVADVEKAKKGLAALTTKKKQKSATAMIKEMKTDIMKARRAGRTWSEISETLAGAGINASVALLSMTLSTKKADAAAPAPAPAPAAVAAAPAAPAAAPVAAPAPAAAAPGKLSDRLRAEQAANSKKSDTNPVVMNGDGTFKINPVTEKL